MRRSQPVTAGQLRNLAALASSTREPMVYPLTRMHARRELRRLEAIRREQLATLRAARSPLDTAT